MTELVRYRMLIDGAWVDAGDGGTFESMNPATGEPWAIVPEATAADVDRAVQAANRAFTEGPWSRTTPTERGRISPPAGGSSGRSVGAARPHRDRRHRQDAQGDALAGEVHRGFLPLLRGLRRQGARRNPAHRQARSVRVYRARATRSGGRGGAVELAALPGCGQARSGAGRRQHRGAQGVGARVGGDAGVRTVDRGGGHSAGGGQHRHRPRRPLRPGADLPPAGGPRELHRRSGVRAPRRAQLGGELRSGLAGTRRQIAVRGVRGRGSRKRGERLHRRHLRSERAELRGRLAPLPAGEDRRSLPGGHGAPGADKSSSATLWRKRPRWGRWRRPRSSIG